MESQTTQCGWCLHHAALSDVGMRRQNNQDSMNVLVASDEDYWEQRGHLFVVCDGMGAHAAGELASKIAADGIPHTYSKNENAAAPAALRKAILAANRQIFDKGRADIDFQGMGTTCSAMVLLPEGVLIGHVGDSRVYRFRDQLLEQLTFDHSLVWEVRAAAENGDDQVAMNLPKNVITRSLGPSPQVKVDLEGPLPVQTGDKYLLCSDGLTGPVPDVVVGTLLAALPADEAARALVDLANLRGGPDNITVIVVEVGEQIEQEVEDESAARQLKSRLLSAVALLAFVAAAVTWFMGHHVPSILSGVGGIVAAILALVVRFQREEVVEEQPMRPLGQAPYAEFDCSGGQETLEMLADVLDRIQQAAERASVKLKPETLEKLHARLAESSSPADAAVSGSSASDLFERVRLDARLVCAIVADYKQARAADQAKFADSPLDLL